MLCEQPIGTDGVAPGTEYRTRAGCTGVIRLGHPQGTIVQRNGVARRMIRIARDCIEHPRTQAPALAQRVIDPHRQRGDWKDRRTVLARLRKIRGDAMRTVQKQAARLDRIELGVEIDQADLERAGPAGKMLRIPGLVQAKVLCVVDVRDRLEVAHHALGKRSRIVVQAVHEQLGVFAKPLCGVARGEIEIVHVARGAADAAIDVAHRLAGVYRLHIQPLLGINIEATTERGRREHDG